MIIQEVQWKAKSAQDQTTSGQAGLSQGNSTEGPHHPETGEWPGPGLQPCTQGDTWMMKDSLINISQDKYFLRSFSLLLGVFQEKERIHTVMEENEKLLEERRDLLQKISEAEEMGSKGMRTASTVQHRYCNESPFIHTILNSNVKFTVRQFFVNLCLNLFQGSTS